MDAENSRPGCLITWYENDAINACFDEEAQHMGENGPSQPNVALPIHVDKPNKELLAFPLSYWIVADWSRCPILRSVGTSPFLFLERGNVQPPPPHLGQPALIGVIRSEKTANFSFYVVLYPADRRLIVVEQQV